MIMLCSLCLTYVYMHVLYGINKPITGAIITLKTNWSSEGMIKLNYYDLVNRMKNEILDASFITNYRVNVYTCNWIYITVLYFIS